MANASPVIYELEFRDGYKLAGFSLSAVVKRANALLDNPGLKIDLSSANLCARGLLKKGYTHGTRITTHVEEVYSLPECAEWVAHRGHSIPTPRPRQRANYVLAIAGRVFYGPVLKRIVDHVNQNKPASVLKNISVQSVKHLQRGTTKSCGGCRDISLRRQSVDEPVGGDWLLVP